MSNLGSLEVSLELKDKVSASLKRIKEQMTELAKDSNGLESRLKSSFDSVKSSVGIMERQFDALNTQIGKLKADGLSTKGLEKYAEKIRAIIDSVGKKSTSELFDANVLTKILGDANDMRNTVSQLQKVIDLSYKARDAYKELSGMKKSGLPIDDSVLTSYKLAFSVGYYRNRMAGYAAAGQKIPDDVLKSYDELEKKINQNIYALKKFKEASDVVGAKNDVVKSFNELNSSMSNTSGILDSLKEKFVMLAGTMGVKKLFMDIVKIGGEIEQQHIALQSIIGDVGKANTLFEQTKQLALKSPFTFGELNRDVKQLAAYGVAYRDMYDTTKRLADISAGLGVSFERIALAYGQVKSRSWLDGKELRQFAYAGIPLLQRLAEMYKTQGKAVSTGDVRKMVTAREVSFEDVQKVLWDMTNSGGQFYNMQLVLSETLLGRYNKLKDAWEIMLSDFAKGDNIIGGTMKKLIDFTTSLVLNMKSVSGILASVGAMFAGKALIKGGGGVAKSVRALSGVDALNAASTAAMRKYQIETQTLVLEGKISQEHAKQVMLNKQAAIDKARQSGLVATQLAMEGKFTPYQLRRIYQEKQITAEQLEQLVGLNLISAKQKELIMNSSRLAGLQLGLGQLISKIGLANIAAIGIGVGAGLYANYKQWSDGVKRLTDDMKTSAQNTAKTLDDTLKTYEGKSVTSANIDALKEVLRNSDLYTESIKRQVDGTRDLVKKYEILIGKIKEAKEVEESKSLYSDSASRVIKSSKDRYKLTSTGVAKDWARTLLADDVVENLKEFKEEANKVSVVLSTSSREYTQAMDSAIKSMIKTKEIHGELAAQLTGQPLDTQVKILADSKVWGKFVENVNNSAHGFDDFSKKIKKASNAAVSKWEDIVNDNIPQMVVSIKKELGITERDVKKFTEGQKEAVQNMIETVAASINFGSETLKNKFVNALRGAFGMAPLAVEKAAKEEEKGLSDVAKRLITNTIKTFGSNGKNPYLTAALARQIAPGDSFSAAADEIRKRYESAAKELKAAKDAGEKNIGKLEFEEKRWRSIAEANGVSLEKSDKKIYGTTKSSGDPIADKWRNRLNLMKEYEAEFNTLVKREGSAEGASKILKNMGWENDLGKDFDYNDPRKSIRDYYETNVKGNEKKKTDRQRSTSKDFLKAITGFDDADIQDEIKLAVKSMQKAVSDAQKNWDLYVKALEATSDSNLAARLAFGSSDKMPASDSAEYFKKQIESYMQGNGVSMKFEDLVGMTSEDIVSEAVGLGERVGKPLAVLVEAYQKATSKLASETIDNYLRIIKESEDYEAKIKSIDRKLQKDLADLMANGGTDAQAQGLKDKANEDKAKVKFDQFKKTSGWIAMFDDLSRVSDEAISSMIDKINKFALTEGLTIEQTKALINAIRKLREENIKRNPFDSIINGYRNAGAGAAYLKNNKADANGNYNVSEADAKRLGIKAGINSRADIASADAATLTDFQKGLDALTNSFKAFETILQPVVDLFDALGENSIADIIGDAVGIGSKALGTASGVAGAFQTLSSSTGDGMSGISAALGNAGPYGAAAAAALSVATQVYALHDKAIQQEIDASKQRQKEAETMFKNLKEELSNALGGMFTTGSYESMRSNLQASYSEAVKQLNLEKSKKKSDDSVIADMKQSVYEAEQELKNFTKTLAEELYSIDYKSFANDLTSALVDAWASGADAAQAYGDAVSDIMKNVVSDVIQQSIIETMIAPLENQLLEYLDANGMVWDDGALALLSQIYDMADVATNAANDAMDKAEYIANQKGGTLKDQNTGTMANGISSITESTADLLASYINAIRANTSVLQLTNTEILTAVKSMSSVMPAIQQSQLDQLQIIATNTTRSAESAELIYGLLNKVANGTLQLAVK